MVANAVATLTIAVLGFKEAAVTDTLVGAGLVVKLLLWWHALVGSGKVR